jgi:hypothetical protein
MAISMRPLGEGFERKGGMNSDKRRAKILDEIANRSGERLKSQAGLSPISNRAAWCDHGMCHGETLVRTCPRT